MVQRSEFDAWVLEWIASEKSKGRKCFDVKRSGNSYYVYYQTTRYNSELKKREKVSGYLGKLVQGIGLIEPERPEETMNDEISVARYGLGVDTGGTFTDAVIIDLDDNTIVTKRKSPTTHRDLSIGLHASVDAVFGSSDVRPEDISLVGISTTLATNSILEGKGGNVGLILIGWNPMEPVHFGERHQVFIKGGFDSRGRATAQLDEKEVRAAVKKVSKGVDAIAISGLFSTMNTSQEKKVKEIASEMTGLPTVAGHELSGTLGIDIRTETTVLNARLIPTVSKFFDDIKRTFIARGINAPIMAYKGDGSVMDLEQAKMYPVETILSGPAASAVGGTTLSGMENCAIIDIGGTSTDIAVMDSGFPMIQEEGASVGRWRTRVKAVDMYTVALGGDSRITLKDSKFTIGPDRVTPLAVLASRYPHVVDKIMFDDLIDYYTAYDDADVSQMTDKERRVFTGMKENGPMTSLAIRDATNGLWMISDELASLTRKGCIEASSLTPTDIMVFLKKFECGSPAGAEAGVHAIASKMGMTEKQAAATMFEEVRMKISEALITKMLDDETEGWYSDASSKLIRKMTSLKRGKALDILPKLRYPIVGVGAPAAAMMADIGERFGTSVMFPEHFDVCNAVGAVTSKISESLTATVAPTLDYRFSASIPFMGMVYYDRFESAVSAASRSLTTYLTEKVKRSGAVNIRSVSRQKVHFSTEGAYGNWDEEALARSINFAEVTVRVTGDPKTL
ncbi:MAG: hydantoinase/oxoprolinase family protein [Methanomassiliicoccaceae archaeon]|jgi:N-methylhydantoinase A/oxoprolinase/acetone carboxylase beta subunit|nr:hydantoinase/oxoprolinase family protein [Methanomassiliicoccaceae archaeon]